MLFRSEMPATKQSNALIAEVCSAIDLELEGGKTTDASSIPIDDLTSYKIEESFTINLKKGEDGKTHYVVLTASVLMNSKHEDYETYGTAEKIAEKVDMIKGTVNQVIAGYTYEDFQTAIETEGVQDAITEALQEMYGSDFIVGITFSGITYQ